MTLNNSIYWKNPSQLQNRLEITSMDEKSWQVAVGANFQSIRLEVGSNQFSSLHLEFHQNSKWKIL